ncbi:fatty acyl-AMP ligase [Streptomyces neyagawaensis]|uniref:fatty acyl-AMP ligase n=1 Tax=Streptomyces neyagawaensis TaxID=42238 RepID=UPI0006E29399|nr:fatty acyl-AMP ligase [Streptomyces neyagawaensis]MDE1685253.1 fatty acyl-AMP ligase [Streptomyces neyagawaensis]
MAEFGSFAELVLTRSDEQGDRDAFLFLADGVRGKEPERLPYRSLDRAAKDIASWLQERGLAGRQVLLLYPSGLDFVKAFVGCLYAGAVAVPAPLPSEQGQHFRRVSGIVRDARVGAVLTLAEHAPEVEAWLAAEGFSDVVCLPTDQGTVGDADAWRDPRLSPEHLAFLQYTSGSTSAPKGVMVSHGNLLANEAAIARSTGNTPDTMIGGWLPFYHDMGLIGHILQPLWLGTTSVLIPPVSFLRKPARWLELVSEYGVNASGGPNFAYDLCVRRVTDAQLEGLDLSTWRTACNGAEPVRAETLQAFTERFGPHGFRAETMFPCYGMAETTLLVTGTPKTRGALLREVDAAGLEQGTLAGPFLGAPRRTLVSSGVALAEDFEVRIVDPETLAEQPEGRVGEIWVRGASVASGYWERPEVNAEIFGARIAGQEELGAWLRTGDMGVMGGGGELFVTGRLKEMVLINGRNIYPYDVESAVRGLNPAIGAGAVFAVDTGGQEHLVVIHEIRAAAAGDDLKSIATDIQRHIGMEFAVPAGNVLLVRPGTVRRTTSGKIQRTLMRKLFLQGAVTALHSVLDPSVRTLVENAATAASAAAGTPAADPAMAPVG